LTLDVEKRMNRNHSLRTIYKGLNMTFIGKLLRFDCNKCGAIEDVTHGLPEGWEWYPLGVLGVGHSCSECLKKENEEKQEIKD